ncbi:MAG TPA: glycosyltransferase family 4 protein [Acidimicrobiales bacterium]|nr:glycosyltransferase family 4 protein [Acidimicrobiales bacterium]
MTGTRRRVVYLDQSAQLSGAQLAMLRLLPALAPWVDARVVVAEDGPLVARLEGVGVATEVLPMAQATREVRCEHLRPGGVGLAGAAGAASYVARLTRRLRRLRPALVHTNSLKAAIYGGLAARAAGAPVIWHIRDRITPDYLPAPAVAVVRAMARRLPDAVLGNDTTLPTLGTCPRPRFSVADPVDPRCFDARRRATVEPSPLRVGMVGRITPWKGQDVFLTAFARAFTGSEAVAVVVGAPLFGEHEYERQLHALVGRLGIADRVEFRGFREDIPAELAALDVFVHSSILPEPFGQVVTEAMAAGLPVVASDAGGPSLIITDGTDGLLTPPRDVDALASALRRLASDPTLRASLGEAARRSARRFSADAAAQRVLEAYRTVLTAHQAGREPLSSWPEPRAADEDLLLLGESG